MIIKHDYSLTNKKLIEKGYAELSVHSLVFDRHFNDEEKAENKKTSEMLTTEQWNKRCDEMARYIHNQLCLVIDELKDKYNIHQLTEENSTLTHFRDNWDLYFWSNKGWNNEDYFDTFSLTFNKKRNAEENMILLNELISIFEKLNIKNISCRVQYTAITNEEKITKDGLSICKQLAGQLINYNGVVGKIKSIGEQYGFFKKGARNHYYEISNEYLVMNFNS